MTDSVTEGCSSASCMASPDALSACSDHTEKIASPEAGGDDHDKNISCPYCPETFSDHVECRRHYYNQHDDCVLVESIQSLVNNGAIQSRCRATKLHNCFLCLQCGALSARIQSFRVHVKYCHAESRNLVRIELHRFMRYAKLRTALASSYAAKTFELVPLFVCLKCCQAYRTLKGLRQHVHTHAQQKAKRAEMPPRVKSFTAAGGAWRLLAKSVASHRTKKVTKKSGKSAVVKRVTKGTKKAQHCDPQVEDFCEKVANSPATICLSSDTESEACVAVSPDRSAKNPENCVQKKCGEAESKNVSNTPSSTTGNAQSTGPQSSCSGDNSAGKMPKSTDASFHFERAHLYKLYKCIFCPTFKYLDSYVDYKYHLVHHHTTQPNAAVPARLNSYPKGGHAMPAWHTAFKCFCPAPTCAGCCKQFQSNAQFCAHTLEECAAEHAMQQCATSRK